MFYPTRPQCRCPRGREITLTLHVEDAPAITLMFDAGDPYDAERTKVAIDEQSAIVDPDSFADAVERAAGALLCYWIQRSAWPPDIRPAED
jgi:hypothetical protein